jgi:hypothetical protein
MGQGYEARSERPEGRGTRHDTSRMTNNDEGAKQYAVGTINNITKEGIMKDQQIPDKLDHILAAIKGGGGQDGN